MRLIFTVFILWWPWKLGQGHHDLIKSLNHPSITIYEVWPESVIRFQEIGCRLAFLVKFWKFQCQCDLEKWGQGQQHLITSFPPPSNVSMQVCSKSTYWFWRWRAEAAPPMLMGSAPKVVCPPSPSVGGHKSIQTYKNDAVNILTLQCIQTTPTEWQSVDPDQTALRLQFLPRQLDLFANQIYMKCAHKR